MMIEDRFFDQTWVQELSNEDFRMLMYLLHGASKKTGIIELNMRMLNFQANTGKNYTINDIINGFGGMIKMLPGRKSTAIFPDYIATNWAKGGKPIDTVRNPLFRSVVQELSSYGLTIANVNALAKKQIVVKGDDEDEHTDVVLSDRGVSLLPRRRLTADYDGMFERFWQAYPSECPRKTDKKKCREKLTALLKKADDPNKMLDEILAGLERWKECDQWCKDNGQFIRAPLVWINNRNWTDEPRKEVKSNGREAGHKESKFNNLF